MIHDHLSSPICYLCVPTESYQFRVPESVAGSAVVAKIRAQDLDVGSNAEMDYRILDGDGLGTFSLLTDPNTQQGLVTVHKVLVPPLQETRVSSDHGLDLPAQHNSLASLLDHVCVSSPGRGLHCPPAAGS